MAFDGRSNEALSQINVTPLVDVMLVLLVIFMVTAPILQQGITVNLPHVRAGALAGEEIQLVVSLAADGKVYLNDTEFSSSALQRSARHSARPPGSPGVSARGRRRAVRRRDEADELGAGSGRRAARYGDGASRRTVMASAYPEILVRPPRSTGLIWTVAVSAAMHALAIALLLASPRGFLGATPPMESYTVDLVAPNVLGGTNLIARARQAKVSTSQSFGRHAAAASRRGGCRDPARFPCGARKPAPASREQKAAKAPEAPRVEPPAGAAEWKLASAAKVKPVAKPAVVPPAEIQAPPTRRKPRPNWRRQRQRNRRRRRMQRSRRRSPCARPFRSPSPDPWQKSRLCPSPCRPHPSPFPRSKRRRRRRRPRHLADPCYHAIDERIEKAIEKRAALVEPEKKNGAGRAASASDLDDKIAAAVRRRVREVGTAAVVGESTEQSGVGGAVGYGPGKGIGGIITDYDYVAYRTQMEARIKEAWVWAGAAPSSSAVVEFNITPAGDIVNVRTKQSSGDASYDASAERAVRRASPLGAPPEKYREAFGSVELEFAPEFSRS